MKVLLRTRATLAHPLFALAAFVLVSTSAGLGSVSLPHSTELTTLDAILPTLSSDHQLFAKDTEISARRAGVITSGVSAGERSPSPDWAARPPAVVPPAVAPRASQAPASGATSRMAPSNAPALDSAVQGLIGALLSRDLTSAAPWFASSAVSEASSLARQQGSARFTSVNVVDQSEVSKSPERWDVTLAVSSSRGDSQLATRWQWHSGSGWLVVSIRMMAVSGGSPSPETPPPSSDPKPTPTEAPKPPSSDPKPAPTATPKPPATLPSKGGPAIVSGATLLRHLTYDSSSGNTHSNHAPSGGVGITTEAVRSGSSAGFALLKPSDGRSSAGGFRAEWHGSDHVNRGAERWHGISYYFPRDYNQGSNSRTWNDRIIFQFADQGSPMFSLHLDANREDLWIRRKLPNRDRNGQPQFETLGRMPFKTGQWYDMVFHVKWTTDNSGFFEVYVDGNRLVDYRGRTLGERTQTYSKWGIYGQPTRLFFDDVWTAEGSGSLR